jgi:hypothetical protein
LLLNWILRLKWAVQLDKRHYPYFEGAFFVYFVFVKYKYAYGVTKNTIPGIMR